MKVKIGDRYIERMVPFKGKYFDWECEVVGFKTEFGAVFADCVRTHPDGRQERVSIDLELLEDAIFYKKVA